VFCFVCPVSCVDYVASFCGLSIFFISASLTFVDLTRIYSCIIVAKMKTLENMPILALLYIYMLTANTEIMVNKLTSNKILLNVHHIGSMLVTVMYNLYSVTVWMTKLFLLD